METPQSKDSLEEKLLADLEVYAKYLGTTNKEEEKELLSKKDEIVAQLMAGKFRDLGGLVAMRGFIYQYYVSVFYAISMVYKKRESWWDAVILEYFDDVALVGNKKIRFIQVKTTRNTHTLSNFTTRKKLKNPEFDLDRFNSWVEKNILNYDYYIKENKEFEVFFNEEDTLFEPQFEIITNSSQNSLQNIDRYTLNMNFNNEEEIEDTDPFKKAIQTPIAISDDEKVEFSDIAKENVDYYLKRLYVNKFGSILELRDDILGMISEIVGTNDARKASINDYIFEKFLSNIIKRCYNDNEETIRREDLVISKDEVENLINRWKSEVKELITLASYQDTAFSVFEKAIENLKHDFNEDYENEKLKDELLNNLGWFQEVTIKEFSQNPMYCVSFIDKLFVANYGLTIWDFKNSKSEEFLRVSLKHIIYFLSFYTEKKFNYKDAKMIFHKGESQIIDNVLFTIYHARDKYNLIESNNRVISNFNSCKVSTHITDNIYCLTLGSKVERETGQAEEALAQFITEATDKKEPSILDVPAKLHFVNIEKFNSFFETLGRTKDSLETFQNTKLLSTWNDYRKKMIN